MSSAPEVIRNPALRTMVEGLSRGLGPRLRGVVLYGSAARGDYQKATSDLNLLLVLEDLSPATLEAASPAVVRWLRSGQPMPRIFSPELIADSADVFPLEFLDIRDHHVAVHGEDPFAGIEIHADHLRLQCEKELREKMMRLREGFIETKGRPRAVGDLLTRSYASFAAVFRGCLRLVGAAVPARNDEVIAAFCGLAELDPAPFRDVAALKRGDGGGPDPRSLFLKYYDELTKAVRRVDRFDARTGGMSP